MDNLRYNPESSMVSAPADDSRLLDSDDSSKFVTPMAKGRKNILSGITVKRDCSVKFDLDSTIESEADVTLESSARKILREINTNRGLISINIDDTVASLEKTDVLDVSPVNVMRQRGKERHISLDLDFSLSSTENSGNHDSIKNHSKDESMTQEDSSSPEKVEAPDFMDEAAEKDGPNTSEKKDVKSPQDLTHSKAESLEAISINKEASDFMDEAAEKDGPNTSENVKSPQDLTHSKAESLEAISINKEAPGFMDEAAEKDGPNTSERKDQNVKSPQYLTHSKAESQEAISTNKEASDFRGEAVENDDDMNEGPFTEDSQHSHRSLLKNQLASNTSQLDGTYVVQNKSDESVKQQNDTYTIGEYRVSSSSGVTGVDDSKGKNQNSPESEESIKKSYEKQSTPLRRTLRNQKSFTDNGIDCEKFTPKRKDNLQDSQEKVKDNSSIENSIGVEKISAPLRRSQRKSFFNQEHSLTKKISQDKKLEDQSEDKLFHNGNNSVLSSKRKSKNKELVPRQKPSFNLESLDYDENLEDLQFNHSDTASPDVDPLSSRIAQHSMTHLKNDKILLEPSVVNASLPKIKISVQEDRKTKSFENTVKEFTPESCSTYIELNCDSQLRSCIGNVSSRLSKAEMPSVDLQNCTEIAMPLNTEISSGSPLMDLDLSTNSDDLKSYNDEPASKHEEDLNPDHALPTKPANQSGESFKKDNCDSVLKPEQSAENGIQKDNDEPDASKHEEDLNPDHALPTKPANQNEESFKKDNSDSVLKPEQSAENGIQKDVLEHEDIAKRSEEHGSQAADIRSKEPEIQEADLAEPQVAIKTVNQESSTNKRKSTDNLEIEKPNEKNETKEFTVPNGTHKKRKTVKTADSRDETIILNKSSLLQRTRSSSSTIKQNESKGAKSINDLSLDSSLELSSIRQVNRKKLIYHSTPVHRASKKAKIDDLAEAEISLDSSNISEIPSSENASNQAVTRESSKKEESSKRVTRSSTSKLSSVKEGSVRQNSKVSSVKEGSVRQNSKVSSVKEASVRRTTKNSSVKESFSNQISNISQRDVSVGVASEVDFAAGTSGMKFSSRRSAREGNSLQGRFIESTQNTTYYSSTTFDSFDDSYDSDTSDAASTGPDPIAIWCEKMNKKTRTKPKPPKLFKPPKCKWVSKELYQYLEKKLKPNYSLEATKYAEGFVMDLFDLYNRVMHAHTPDLTTVKKKAKELGICAIELEFALFLHRFMPFHFTIKVLPTGGAFNSKVPSSSSSPFDEL